MSKDNITSDLDRIAHELQDVLRPIAKRILRSTVADVPRPAFDTGTLRRSGRAYVAGKFVSSTHRMREAQGRNPKTESRNRNANPGGGDYAGGASDIISIIYKTDYAEKMHGWHGKFTDSESGPGFISSKMTQYHSIITEEINRILR